MADDLSFQELLQRVRQGDEAAAVELLRRYEAPLRHIIHVRLVDARLRRLFDAEDICQSVLASFFVRAALGQYELNRPEDLLKLLAVMARNKLADKARRPSVERHADRRVPLDELPDQAIASREGTPSQRVALQDLLSEARRRLSPDERHLLDLRDQGLDWAAIAAQVGGSPEALRKRLARAIDLVVAELGLEEGSHE
ncbi:MAG TPA: sigma-70 family RNA polymerase sigma factor [Gemmataceae bacterium]|nr:sigma-70 family RNA polymerase sigma factor [Gemmataceae bacterium]